jgi:hypothetical protein
MFIYLFGKLYKRNVKEIVKDEEENEEKGGRKEYGRMLTR